MSSSNFVLVLGSLHEKLGLPVLEGADDVLKGSNTVEELFAEGHEVFHVDGLVGKVHGRHGRRVGKIVGLVGDLLTSGMGLSSFGLQLQKELMVLLVKVCVLCTKKKGPFENSCFQKKKKSRQIVGMFAITRSTVRASQLATGMILRANSTVKTASQQPVVEKEDGEEASLSIPGTPEGTVAADAVRKAFTDLEVERGQHPVVGTFFFFFSFLPLVSNSAILILPSTPWASTRS